MFFKQNGWKKLITILMVLGLLLGFSSFLLPGAVSAAAGPITIKVDGETIVTLTPDDLEAMTLGVYTYSSINTWPTKNWYVGAGPELADLLAIAVMPEDVKLIKFKSRDNFTMTFTKKELLDDPRYYFPGLTEGHQYFGEIPGSPAGAQVVPAILALESANTNDPADMGVKSAPHLLFGQRWVTEQTNQAFAKYVSEIDLLTTAPEKWDNPMATPAAGTVPAGTKVRLSSLFNDADKVYYTTDGSDPTYRSPMYNWIAKRWWGSRSDELDEINKPIEITEDTTIKAVAIGIGREDSDIVTFEYKVAVDTVDVTGVSIAESDQTLDVDGTVQLTAIVEPDNATNKDVIWSTSDGTVATVSETGLVTAVSAGTATITVTTADGEFTDSVDVIVVGEGKAELQQAINEALAVDEGDYTPHSWKALNNTLRNSQVILSRKHIAQASVDQALLRLTTALAQLVEKPDKNALEAAINTAQALNPAGYTPRSWRQASNALTVAVRVFQNENATQADVDQAAERLNNALNALVPVGS